LSAGRVQSVAVRLVVEREREIDAFVPAEYWTIGGIFTVNEALCAKLSENWSDFLTNTGNGERTKHEKEKWLAEHDAFTAELVELAGKKFEATNKEQARKAAELLGYIVDKDNTDRRLPDAKGPAEEPDFVRRSPRQLPALQRAHDREEAHDEQAARAVHHQHAASRRRHRA
jgi:hypothetical protein